MNVAKSSDGGSDYPGDPLPEEGVELLGARIIPTLGYDDEPHNHWYPSLTTTDPDHIFDPRVHTLPDWIIQLIPAEDKPFVRRVGGREIEHGGAEE